MIGRTFNCPQCNAQALPASLRSSLPLRNVDAKHPGQPSTLTLAKCLQSINVCLARISSGFTTHRLFPEKNFHTLCGSIFQYAVSCDLMVRTAFYCRWP